jgi:hypothetical protein
LPPTLEKTKKGETSGKGAPKKTHEDKGRTAQHNEVVDIIDASGDALATTKAAQRLASQKGEEWKDVAKLLKTVSKTPQTASEFLKKIKIPVVHKRSPIDALACMVVNNFTVKQYKVCII